MAISHRKPFITLSVFSTLNSTYEERPLEHFGFICDRRTTCGVKINCHGRKRYFGDFCRNRVVGTVFKHNTNKSKTYTVSHL